MVDGLSAETGRWSTPAFYQITGSFSSPGLYGDVESSDFHFPSRVDESAYAAVSYLLTGTLLIFRP